MTRPTWQKIFTENFRSLPSLLQFLELNEEMSKELLSAPEFSLNVPLRLAKKMQKGTTEDPLFKQFVPSKNEQEKSAQFFMDPVGDCAVQRTPNLLHKYEGRALLITTEACAMHCRYCFRQNYPYAVKEKSFAAELEILRGDPSLHEIILSGGDPLSLSNRLLKELFESLDAIPHLKRIRFHTRFPIGIPERIDAEFLRILAAAKKQIIFVIHCNHVNELDEDVLESLKSIQKLGIPLLNQAVLLKGINDSEEALEELFGTLSSHGVMAYYLHQLDKVQGAMHFEVELAKGHALIAHLEAHLPGYAVPKYVYELAGHSSKLRLINANG